MNTSNELPSTNHPTTSAEPNVDFKKISSPIKKNEKGRFVGKQQKLMIVNLYKAKKQQQPGMKYKELMASISADSGIGMRKVIQTISEYKNTGECKSTNKTKIRPTIIDKIDDFNKNAIRQKIHGFWFRNEIPTIKKIVQAINDDTDLPNLPSTSLRNRNSALTERADLVVWRQKYIEDIRRYRDEGRIIYFLDETWVNAGQCSSKVWIDTSVKSHTDAFLKGLTTGPKIPSGKGKRLIVVHIGSADGFVERGLLCFESKKNTADYHDEMNGDTFYDWFLMDNASYHSVKKDPVPTTAWKKEDIQNWLKSKGVVLDKPMIKFRLLDMKVTSEMWANFVSHAIKEEDKFCDIDIISDRMMNDDDHKLTITVDITEKINFLNLELQGKEKQIIDMISHVQAFSSKLAYWENKMKNGDFQHFPTLQETIINYSENIYEPTNHINIFQHLCSEFKRRFNDFKILELVAQFISNPFTGDVETKANEIGNLFNLDKTVLEMEIITLQNDSILKITSEFWKYASTQKYPNLQSIALRVTSFFGSTWLCEITDSNLDSSLRAAVSNYTPQFSKLAENQCQLSH
ncbi:hypothetical protein QTP88_000840 [Uroleucon formosanum]